MGAQGLVVGLGPPPEDRRERMPGRPDVPRPDAASLGRLDRDHLAWLEQQRLGPAVHVQVDEPGVATGAERRVGRVLGRDQVLAVASRMCEM